jgi:hypothetical protein
MAMRNSKAVNQLLEELRGATHSLVAADVALDDESAQAPETLKQRESLRQSYAGEVERLLEALGDQLFDEEYQQWQRRGQAK